jgi:predicted neutral ceramidase superfamily lipid hydrolase
LLQLVTHAAEVAHIGTDLGLRVGVVRDPDTELGKVLGRAGVGVVVGDTGILVIWRKRSV